MDWSEVQPSDSAVQQSKSGKQTKPQTLLNATVISSSCKQF